MAFSGDGNCILLSLPAFRSAPGISLGSGFYDCHPLETMGQGAGMKSFQLVFCYYFHSSRLGVTGGLILGTNFHPNPFDVSWADFLYRQPNCCRLVVWGFREIKERSFTSRLFSGRECKMLNSPWDKSPKKKGRKPESDYLARVNIVPLPVSRIAQRIFLRFHSKPRKIKASKTFLPP